MTFRCTRDPRSAVDLESLSPYVERPTIPEGVTVDEYRRARVPQTNRLVAHLLGWLRHQPSSMASCAESCPGAGA
jgi:hypothetical protein